jgi:hypothetical protein
MDIVNFPGIIAEHGLLNSGDVNLAKDLILIGKQMGPQRDGTQYENMAITVAQFANIVSGGGNETLAQTLVLGNVTGGTNIIFSGTDFAIFQSGAFSGRLSRLPLTGNHAWNLPNKSGTIALLSDIPAPTPPQSLSSVLAVGNTTGPINISIDSGQGITFNQGFPSVLLSSPNTASRVWSLPDNSGTIALLSDIPAPDITLYSGNSVIGTNRVATLTDNLTFNAPNGTINNQFGIGADPMGWGQGGILNYSTDLAANIEGWGGLFDSSSTGDPYWLLEVYDTGSDAAGFFAGYSIAQTLPYSSLYYFDGAGGTYKGFEANNFGEQLYSQRLGLVTTGLTAADRVLFVSNAGGYIKATTYADLATQLAIPTLYSADSTIASATRNVTINTTLNFLHGAAGVNGSFQLQSGGYVKNTGNASVNNYFEYNHNTGTFKTNSDTHTTTGFRATRIGTLGNPTAEFSLMAGSNGNCYLDLAPTVPIFFFLTNNTATVAGSIYGANGHWGLGGFADFGAKVTVTGMGSTSATNGQFWKNSLGAELMRFTDAGGLAIGINSLTGGFANAEKLRVEATVSTDYTNTVVFNQTYSNTVNNGNTASTVTTQLYKATAFNTGEMKAQFTLARNDGSGSMNFMYGTESMVWAIGAANIGSAFAYSARVQVRDGVITNLGGLDISYQENNAPAVVTNMIGVLVRTPVNVAGITVTNTYGMLIQPNAIGVNNYGFVSSSQATNGFGTLTPSLNALSDFSTTSKAPIKLGGGMTSAQASALTAEDSMVVYVTDTNGTFISVGFWGRENGAWIKL